MRVALIVLAASGHSPIIAGKSVAERQLGFALAAGAERVVVLCDGASAEAVGLRHVAESAGARFQAIRDSHGLLGAVAVGDELLVLAAGLLPEAAEALDIVRQAPGILVLPAQAGAAAGFERIDLERAWAGTLLAPGRLIDRLSELPPDSEPAPALLRIALHARLKENRLSEALLVDGSWVMAKASDQDALTARWLARHLPAAERYLPSRQAARFGLRIFGQRLLRSPKAGWVFDGGTALLLAVALALAWFGLSGIGLIGVAAATLLAALSSGIIGLRNAPFAARRRGLDWHSAIPWLVDVVLVCCAVSAIVGDWPHRLFPPLVLVGTLRARKRRDLSAVLEDRAVLALILACATLVGYGEAAIMLIALVLIAADAAKTALGRE